jgi:hypothetical protein
VLNRHAERRRGFPAAADRWALWADGDSPALLRATGGTPPPTDAVALTSATGALSCDASAAHPGLTSPSSARQQRRRLPRRRRRTPRPGGCVDTGARARPSSWRRGPRLAARALKHAPAARAETMRGLAIYRTSAALNKAPRCRPPGRRYDGYLVDSASSHMLVLKIKPCMSKYKQLYSETANGSLNQLSFI